MANMCKEVCGLGKGVCDPSKCEIINEQLVDMQLLLQKQEEIIRNLKQTPALSIVMPVLDAEIEYINSDDFFSIQDRKTVAEMTVARIRERTISCQEIK